MKRIIRSACAIIVLMAVFSTAAPAQKKVVNSKTDYARQVLQPYVDSGQLPGAVSVFYNDGVQETCCIGYADVKSGRRIGLDNAFMQCSQKRASAASP